MQLHPQNGEGNLRGLHGSKKKSDNPSQYIRSCQFFFFSSGLPENELRRVNLSGRRDKARHRPLHPAVFVALDLELFAAFHPHDLNSFPLAVYRHGVVPDDPLLGGPRAEEVQHPVVMASAAEAVAARRRAGKCPARGQARLRRPDVGKLNSDALMLFHDDVPNGRGRINKMGELNQSSGRVPL